MGHWDVLDMAGAVAESQQLVDAGRLSAEQWKWVVCDNPVEMSRRANPRFFDGPPPVAGYRRDEN